VVEATIPPHDCVEALSEVMGMYRYEASPFEGQVWQRIMCSVPPERFLRFLQQYVATSNGFPPKPNDATKALELAIDPEGAYAQVERLVREYGPYTEPPINDPVLITTVLYMGGWVTLNEQMPDPSAGFAVKNFRDRFNAAFTQAVNAVRIRNELPARPLLSLATPRTPPAALLQHAQAARLSAPATPDAADPVQRRAPMSRHQRFGNTPS
jgi:hypothetical protein